jgi:hypothetical protein
MNVLHREEVGAAESADIVDRRNVRVLQLGREPRLVQEHAHEQRVIGPLAQDAFEDTIALDPGETRATREEDLGHAADCQLCEDLIAIRSRPDFAGCLRHAAIVRRSDGGCQIRGPSTQRVTRFAAQLFASL